MGELSCDEVKEVRGKQAEGRADQESSERGASGPEEDARRLQHVAKIRAT